MSCIKQKKTQAKDYNHINVAQAKYQTGPITWSFAGLLRT